jgi:hypothetical protein
MKKGASSHHEGVGVEIGALCVMKPGGDDETEITAEEYSTDDITEEMGRNRRDRMGRSRGTLPVPETA